MRIIARLNIGGPAVQAITLTKRLEEFGFSSVLVRGSEGREEGNMDPLAERLGVRPVHVRWLRRDPSWRDVLALGALARIVRRERPHIVHTHAAKGGTLGRIAAILAPLTGHPRPILIHTFHGHSLTGYFSPPVAAVFSRIERVLARYTDCLIAVSEEVRDELVRLGVAPASRFAVVPLGLDLSGFAADPAVRSRIRAELREQLGIPADAFVVTLVARLVPIKRVDRFLRLARTLSRRPNMRFLIVGDGELGDSLRQSSDARAIHDQLVWLGFTTDMPAVYFASDIVVQTSDNEGTPVALIEAQAAGLPVASTKVGGTASLVPEECLADVEDFDRLVAIVEGLVRGDIQTDPETAREIAKRYDITRLLEDIAGLYRVYLPPDAPPLASQAPPVARVHSGL